MTGTMKRGVFMHIQPIGRSARIPEERCDTSHKIRFTTEAQALSASEEYGRYNRFKAGGVYHCKDCGDYHITSKREDTDGA